MNQGVSNLTPFSSSVLCQHSHVYEVFCMFLSIFIYLPPVTFTGIKTQRQADIYWNVWICERICQSLRRKTKVIRCK